MDRPGGVGFWRRLTCHMAILARPSGVSRITARGSLQHFRGPRPVARWMLHLLSIGARARSRVQLRLSDSLFTANSSLQLPIDNKHFGLHVACVNYTSLHRSGAQDQNRSHEFAMEKSHVPSFCILMLGPFRISSRMSFNIVLQSSIHTSLPPSSGSLEICNNLRTISN